jgi:hypothetical protein
VCIDLAPESCRDVLLFFVARLSSVGTPPDAIDGRFELVDVMFRARTPADSILYTTCDQITCSSYRTDPVKTTGTKFHFIVLVVNAVARATGRTVRQGQGKKPSQRKLVDTLQRGGPCFYTSFSISRFSLATISLRQQCHCNSMHISKRRRKNNRSIEKSGAGYKSAGRKNEIRRPGRRTRLSP